MATSKFQKGPDLKRFMVRRLKSRLAYNPYSLLGEDALPYRLFPLCLFPLSGQAPQAFN